MYSRNAQLTPEQILKYSAVLLIQALLIQAGDYGPC